MQHNQERRSILRELTEEERNAIIAKAIDAWCEKKWAQFGRWTFNGIAVALFGALITWIAVHGGFRP